MYNCKMCVFGLYARVGIQMSHDSYNTHVIQVEVKHNQHVAHTSALRVWKFLCGCFFQSMLTCLRFALTGNCPAADGTREEGVQEESRPGEREGAREGEVGHGPNGNGKKAARGRLQGNFP